jgi:hypothetical protein
MGRSPDGAKRNPGSPSRSTAAMIPGYGLREQPPSGLRASLLRSNLRYPPALGKHAAAAHGGAAQPGGGSPCASISSSTTSPAFGITRKRRKSFPSETQVRRGDRVVHGDVELTEKLGRNDLCPCGSGRRFQTLLHGIGTLRRRQPRVLLSGSDGPSSQGGLAEGVTRRLRQRTAISLREIRLRAGGRATRRRDAAASSTGSP